MSKVEIGDWICDICHSKMNVKKVGKNRWEISCPECGSTWYVDNDGEYINDMLFRRNPRRNSRRKNIQKVVKNTIFYFYSNLIKPL